MTFADSYTLEVGGERVELAWHGPNHTPDNIYIHFPDHDTLMLIDVVNAGWVPIYNTNLSEDVQGYMQAPDIALSYPWSHLICGHLGRPATREDVALHQQYIADIEASSREALASVNPVPYYMRYGENVWAGVKGHLDAVTERAAAPVIAKYTGVLAAADIEAFTMTTTFAIMQSLRLDKGPSGPVHPDQNAHRGRRRRPPRCAWPGPREEGEVTLSRMIVTSEAEDERRNGRPRASRAPEARSGDADSSSGAWLRRARSKLRKADPVMARLIDEQPAFDPRAWLAQLPRWICTVPCCSRSPASSCPSRRLAGHWAASRSCSAAISPLPPSCWQ